MAAAKNPRAVILRAVSSKPQAGDDKVSLETQNTECLEFCKRRGYTVVANLVIPGYSRYNSDIEKLFGEYRKQGITAYDELAELFRNRLMDVLVGYHPSRFGRANVPFFWCVENVVKSGGIVEFVKGGIIDANNLQFAGAMLAMVATDGVTKLVADRKAGMEARAQRGLSVGSSVPFFHISPVDQRGRSQTMIVNREVYQRLIDDLFDVVVNHQVAWDNVEVELAARGHLRNGTKYPWHYFYNVVQHPPFWGHVGIGYASRKNSDRAKYALWMIDEAEADKVPDGVKIFYNVCESVYQGDQRVRFMAEIKRRYHLIRGKARTRVSNAFSGLLICGECRRNLNATGSSTSGYRGYRCNTHYVIENREYLTGRKCSQWQSVNYEVVKAWFNNHLRQLIQSEDPSGFLTSDSTDMIATRLEQLSGELRRVNQRIDVLTKRVSEVPDNVVNDIYRQMQDYGNERDAIDRQIKKIEIERAINDQQVKTAQLVSVEIAEMGLAAFWEQPEHFIHQKLSMLMGNWKVVVEKGEIMGVIPVEGN